MGKNALGLGWEGMVITESVDRGGNWQAKHRRECECRVSEVEHNGQNHWFRERVHAERS